MAFTPQQKREARRAEREAAEDQALNDLAAAIHDPYYDLKLAYDETITEASERRDGISMALDQQRRKGVVTSGALYHWLPVIEDGPQKASRFAAVPVRRWTRGQASLAAKKSRVARSTALIRPLPAHRSSRIAESWAWVTPRGP
jgi:hypothetical protein